VPVCACVGKLLAAKQIDKAKGVGNEQAFEYDGT
jgi:hypothetical protein